jgi:putative ABC transport system permease protein
MRMLLKYPGLTVVGGLAMAFAIWIGVVTFQLAGALLYPSLPLPDGDRIVELRNWDAEANNTDARALHDFVVWRDALRTVTDIGAFREGTRNLVIAGDDAQPVEVAEITSEAFRIAPQPPLLGRTLQPADEQPGAPMVVVDRPRRLAAPLRRRRRRPRPDRAARRHVRHRRRCDARGLRVPRRARGMAAAAG